MVRQGGDAHGRRAGGGALGGEREGVRSARVLGPRPQIFCALDVRSSRRVSHAVDTIVGRADVAQLVEHFTRNEGVPGSNPGVGLRSRVAIGTFAERASAALGPLLGPEPASKHPSARGHRAVYGDFASATARISGIPSRAMKGSRGSMTEEPGERSMRLSLRDGRYCFSSRSENAL